MPRPTNRRDLSQVSGNPTHAIEQHYQELMSATDVDQLKQMAVSLVKPYVGKSMSELNFRKFTATLQKQFDLHGVQKFLTNFLMSGSGMAVGESAVDAIAGVLTEGTNHRLALTDRQVYLMRLVGRYGFNATLRV